MKNWTTLSPPILVFLSFASFAQNGSPLSYPAARKSNLVDDYQGTRVPDPYRWLENDSSRETTQWVQAENNITFSYLAAIPFRDAWKKRITELSNFAKYSEPFRRKNFYYYYENSGLQNQPVLFRQPALDAPPELVIDPNTFSSDGTTIMSTFSLSQSGRYAVYALSRGGSDWETYFVRDMSSGRDLPDSLSWVKVSQVAWLGNGFYYSRYPTPAKGQELSSKNENHQVYYHRLGTPQQSDELIYEDRGNPQRFHIAETTEDERYTFLSISDRGKGFEGNALLYRDNQEKGRAFLPIVPTAGKFQYSFIGNDGSKFLILTNENAPGWKILEYDAGAAAGQRWKTIVSEKPEPISSASTDAGQLFVTYLKDVTSKVYQYDYSGILSNEIALPGLGTAGGFSGEKDDPFVFYIFSSLNYPPTIFRYDPATHQSAVFRRPQISFDPEKYETRQIFYSSKDGTHIPMFIVSRKGLVLDGSHPSILYAYGGFNISILPIFSTSLLTWLEQGGVYAVANLRGGSEYGEKWHEAGMLLKKQNVFDDFIAAAQYLIDNKYTSSAKLAIRGASNGGLLVGAVTNQRPDLFHVAIAQAGVMDMLRFHKYTIGWNWIPEYGCSDSTRDFQNLYGYSPVHNIREQLNYPAIIVTTADHDDRVVPAHSFKYVATLQEKYRGPNPILIRIDTNSGHGSSNMTKAIEIAADIYSFIFFNMGLRPVFPPQ